MRILVLSNNATGLWRFRRELFERLLQNGHSVKISVPDGRDVDRLRETGCMVDLCEKLNRRGKNPFQDLSLYRHYRALLKEFKPNMVLTYTIKPNVYGGMACAGLKIPYIANVTGLGDAIERGGLLSRLTLMLYQSGLKEARCVFFQNEENRRFFLDHGIITGRERLIPGSGVNLDAWSYKEDDTDTDTVRFLYVGRIMKDKGIRELLDAMPRVKEACPHARLTVVGDFDEDLREMIKTATANDVLEHYDMTDRVASYYEEAHCIVLPSYHEGMSNVLQEAAATGRPAISTNVSGCKEIIEEGRTGFLVPPRDSEALAEAMKRFAALPAEKRSAMGREARKKMEREFDRQQVVDAYLQEIGEGR